MAQARVGRVGLYVKCWRPLVRLAAIRWSLPALLVRRSWFASLLVRRSAGPPVRRSAGPPVRPSPPVRWSAGPLVRWSAGPPVRRSAGPLVRWPGGPLVRWSAGPLVRGPLLPSSHGCARPVVRSAVPVVYKLDMERFFCSSDSNVRQRLTINLVGPALQA